MVCVPAILITAFALGTNSPALIPLPSWLTVPNLPLNVGTLAAIGYSLFYILLEPVAGSMLVPILIGSTAYAKHLTTVVPSMTNKVAIGIHIFSWIAQFIGHGAFEGRAPALMDNLVQALVLAPFFVWMELLFKCGYRPELQSRVDKAVQKELEKRYAALRANGATKNGSAK